MKSWQLFGVKKVGVKPMIVEETTTMLIDQRKGGSLPKM